MGKLDGKRALITGGASGIGAEIVACFAAEGAAIGILDLSGDAAQALAGKMATAHGVSATSAVADVSDDAAVTAAIAAIEAEIGATDILVNCAGIDNTGWQLWRHTMARPSRATA
ncbi:MAG: SDR family NAD(P)-dependent oxidoreductase [Pseudomonadota bacterium]